MPTIESATPVQFAAGSFFPTSYRRLPHSGTGLFVPWHKFWRLANGTCKRKGLLKNGVKASAEEPGEAALGPIKKNAKPSHYHPFEDVIESELLEGEDARLTPAESSRTIIEVNNKATLMFSNLVNDEVRENIFLPDLPYATDEYGNIYFQVKNNEDILPTLAAEDNLVQVFIGLDTTELLREMDSVSSSDFGINIEELNDEDGDIDDEDNDDEEDEEDGSDDSDWTSDVEEEEDVEDLNGSLGDWAKLETTRSFHPMYFANKMVEAVLDDPINYMDQPPAGLAIQGLLRPALLEDYSVIQKHMFESKPKSDNSESNHIEREAEDKVGDLGTINGDTHMQMPSQDTTAKPGNTEIDESLSYGTSFCKLEMMKIQLISAHGTQTNVEVEDFRKATPDAIAHSAANIISRLKAGGEKTLQALISLCWRCKGIQVEEASVIGIDTLGFDLRICSGKQVQTLRFAFNSRASSEYSAERQLNDLLFPRTHHKLEKRKDTQQTQS